VTDNMPYPDPYAGSILHSGLGGILSPERTLQRLTVLPPLPGPMEGVPIYIRRHLLMNVRDLHIPPLVEARLHQTVDLCVRQGYRHRPPESSATWGALSGEYERRSIFIAPAHAACVVGFSGTGKTQACLRCLLTFPRQSIFHEAFPRVNGGMRQVVYQSTEVPPSGLAADMARALMQGWKEITGTDRFDAWLAKERISNGMTALDEWLQVARFHFLGILHLDEVQNLFKLSSLKQRANRSGSSGAPELSIVEDKLLRWILYITNTGQIPVLVSGTPDGIDALSRRLSTLQRLNMMGHHLFEPFSEGDTSYAGTFLKTLGAYQYVKRPIEVNEALATLILELTGGIQRVIIALWVAAHRVAFDRNKDDLTLEDFTTAAATWLRPLAPAIAAIRNKDAVQMSRYEDLTKRDTAFWASFWAAA
jgi:AAA domain